MALPTISASKIKVFKTCHKQYYYKYIVPRANRPVEDKNIGALLGSALHEAIERKYRAGDNPTVVFQDLMITTLDEWEEQGLKVNGTEWFSKSLKEGKDMLKKFDWDRFDPIELELEFYLPFPNKAAPIAIVNGYIDMITSDAQVIDHKSQRDRLNQGQLNHDPQFIIYAWAYQQMYGQLPRATVWNHLRNQKLYIADVLTDFDFKIGQLTYDIDAMLNANRYPRRQMDSICMTKCSFYSLCYGLKAKQVIEDDEEE